ncbi:ion channel [Eremomyces bilateralis CBS 781.70]|uniref:Ion channel n=1 Tax=Eremomyces bilateralis CBS 781.70 TaxID=1392243 RepID=A0A6G1G5E4_9PEZI|nr:ion channel [Eremomyces bilateralis CBS 781.70]KAF1813238.1 ion channel [Eremomyces bilateralis CBS 781.70]
MANLFEEGTQSLLHASEHVSRRTVGYFKRFLDWALQDNVLEVAVGLIIAAAFTAVVSSLTTDIILPIVSLLPFFNRNLDEKFAILRGGPHSEQGYNTIKQALDDGAVVFAYGSFLDKVVRFMVLGLTMYVTALVYGWMSKDNIVRHSVRCKYCRKRISEKATRCFNCTSWQDGREEIN